LLKSRRETAILTSNYSYSGIVSPALPIAAFREIVFHFMSAQVGDILGVTDGALVLDEQFLAEHRDRNAFEVSGNFVAKCVGNFDA
jgi:hypothetical protein